MHNSIINNKDMVQKTPGCKLNCDCVVCFKSPKQIHKTRAKLHVFYHYTNIPHKVTIIVTHNPDCANLTKLETVQKYPTINERNDDNFKDNFP